MWIQLHQQCLLLSHSNILWILQEPIVEEKSNVRVPKIEFQAPAKFMYRSPSWRVSPLYRNVFLEGFKAKEVVFKIIGPI